VPSPRLLRALVRGAIGLFAVLAVVLPLWHAARTHPYFGVHEVRWTHHGRLSEAELRDALGVPDGTNIWSVDVQAVAARLRRLPWVRSASVRRDLPDRLLVSVGEYRPAAIVAVAAPHPGLFFVAGNGRIFAPVGDRDARDLPYVTGLTGADLGGDDGFGPQAVHTALALLRHVRLHAPEIGALSEVHVAREDGVTLIPMHRAVPIALGWGTFPVKLARASRVLGLWRGRDREIAGINCMFDNDIIVRTRAARATNAPKPAAAGA
jgi:cell division protein FtsQ